MALVSYAARLAALAGEDPGHLAVTDERRSVTRRELEEGAERTARSWAAAGIGQDDLVTIALPNSVEFMVAVVACWKLGAVPQPVSARLPRPELDAIIDLAQPRLVLEAGWEVPTDEPSTAERPDAVSNPWKAMTSGGSTGRPKLILASAPGLTDPEANPRFMLERDGCMVMPGPLYHNAPFVWAVTALLAGNHVVLGGRFDAATTLRLIADHGAQVVYLVPTMMLRIWRLPEDERLGYDLSSLKAVWHLAAPCPPWLKQGWIDWLGPDRIWELYAGTEAQASTIITGREWLEHRGSVGRTVSGQIRIVGTDGDDLPPGEVGEVYMRPPDPSKPTYRYVGATARTLDDGWESLGDMGWMDADGYLYLTDRRTDMVLVGGANVYPAEVEAALEEHTAVRSCAVVGLPDEDLGSRLHAIVQLSHADAAAEDDLRSHLAERLAPHKVPRSYEFVDEPVRDDAGKVRRTALRDERS
jgi:bile acid-coenzyme A ligase